MMRGEAVRCLCSGNDLTGAPKLSPDAAAAAATYSLGTADEAERGTSRAPFAGEEDRR
jgi:hypothetical protein